MQALRCRCGRFLLLLIIASMQALSAHALTLQDALKQARTTAWHHDLERSQSAYQSAIQAAPVSDRAAIQAERQFQGMAAQLPPWKSHPSHALTPPTVSIHDSPALRLFGGWTLARMGYRPEAYQVLSELNQAPDTLPAFDRVLLPQALAELLLSGQPPNLARAQPLVAEVLDRRGSDVEAQALLGRYLIADKRYAQAVDILKPLQPAPEATFLLAEAYNQLDDRASALQCAESILALAPDHVPSLLALAAAAEQAGDLTRAVPYLRRAVQADPALLASWLADAEASLPPLFKADLNPADAREALRRWQRVLITDEAPPRQTEALLILSAIRWRLGQKPPLVSVPESGVLSLAMSPVLALASESPAKTLASVLLAQQKTTAAIEPRPAFESLWPAESHAQDAPLVEAVAILLAQDETQPYENANAALDRFQGDDARDYLRAGHLLMILQAHDLAESVYQRGKIVSPTSKAFQGPLNQVASLRNAAQSAAQEGDVLILKKKTRPMGLARLQQAAAMAPFSSSTQLKLAEALSKSGQKAPAALAMQRAVWLQPGLLGSRGFAKRYRKLTH